MSNSGSRDPKDPERHQKITIGRVATRSHLRAERTHGTGSLSQRGRDMLIAGGLEPAFPLEKPPQRVRSSVAGTSRPRSAPRPVPCGHNCPQMCPSVFVLAGCRFTYTCVYGQPASAKGGNRYARPLGAAREESFFLKGRGCN